MNIKYLRVALVGLLLGAVASCVNYQEIDQEACGGDVNCIAQRQQTRVMATGMMMQYNQNQQLINSMNRPLFYAMPPMNSGGNNSVTCSSYRIANQVHTNCN
jgi:hypothetical protein